MPLLLFILSISQLADQSIDTLWSENWCVDAGTWQVGYATSRSYKAHEGSMCVGTILSGNYTENVDSRLVRLKKFPVPFKAKNPRLKFTPKQ